MHLQRKHHLSKWIRLSPLPLQFFLIKTSKNECHLFNLFSPVLLIPLFKLKTLSATPPPKCLSLSPYIRFFSFLFLNSRLSSYFQIVAVRLFFSFLNLFLLICFSSHNYVPHIPSHPNFDSMFLPRKQRNQGELGANMVTGASVSSLLSFLFICLLSLSLSS